MKNKFIHALKLYKINFATILTVVLFAKFIPYLITLSGYVPHKGFSILQPLHHFLFLAVVIVIAAIAGKNSEERVKPSYFFKDINANIISIIIVWILYRAMVFGMFFMASFAHKINDSNAFNNLVLNLSSTIPNIILYTLIYTSLSKEKLSKTLKNGYFLIKDHISIYGASILLSILVHQIFLQIYAYTPFNILHEFGIIRDVFNLTERLAYLFVYFFLINACVNKTAKI